MSLQSCVTLFQEWREKYPTWELLQAFLESEESGVVRVVDSTETVCILRYDKALSRMEDSSVRWCRSVVWDKVRHLPLSVAPPKASTECFPYADWTVEQAKVAIQQGKLSVEEYADGFMIQVYVQKGDPQVHIASRSRQNASGTFYSAKTLGTLFREAYGSEDMRFVEEAEADTSENHVAWFWSYVVQHPEHRVVCPFSTPRLHLVQKGVVDTSGIVTLWDGFPSFTLPLTLESTEPPSTSSTSSESAPSPSSAIASTLSDVLRSMIQKRPWWFRGIVVKDTSGQRWRFRSEKYMAIRSLRGNESNVYERYARLFTQNLSSTYYEYYPEDMIPFSLCGVFMNDLIQMLHRFYIGIYIRRSLTFPQVNRLYRPHLYAIHGVYLTSLRPTGRRITDQDIRVYLMAQPPARIALLIRNHQEEYHSRVSQGA